MMLRFMMWLSWVLVQVERMARQAPIVARAVLVPVATVIYLLVAVGVFAWAAVTVFAEVISSIPKRVQSGDVATIDAAGLVLRHVRRIAQEEDDLSVVMARAGEIFMSASAGLADGAADVLQHSAPAVEIDWDPPVDNDDGSEQSGSAWLDGQPVGRVTVRVRRKSPDRVLAERIVRISGRERPSSTVQICADMREATEAAFDLQSQAAQAVADELVAEAADLAS